MQMQKKNSKKLWSFPQCYGLKPHNEMEDKESQNFQAASLLADRFLSTFH